MQFREILRAYVGTAACTITITDYEELSLARFIELHSIPVEARVYSPASDEAQVDSQLRRYLRQDVQETYVACTSDAGRHRNLY